MPRRRKYNTTSSKAAKSKWNWPSIANPLEPFKAIDWFIVRRTVNVIAWLAIVGGLAGLWVWGVPKLQAFATVQHHSNIVDVRFANPPAWFRGDLATALTRTARMPLIDGDPLRRDDLVAVRESLVSTGWFDDVQQVRRVSEDMVEITAKFVTPYTVIREKDGDHLIDPAGKLLPRSYPPGSRTNFIAISGPHFKRPANPGQVWEGADVAAGLKMLRLIAQQPWKSQIVEVDVSGYIRDEPIKLRTDGECAITWGSAPGEERALEVLAEGKIDRLNYLFSHYKRIDGGHVGGLDITNQKYVATR